MPFDVKFNNFFSWPQARRIPNATSNNDGVMSKTQAAQLAALVAGGGVVPGPFVTWASLGFFDGFGSGSAPLGAAESRVVGDEVQLSGTVIGPIGGTAGNFHCTTLPENQRPGVARILTGSYQVGSNPRVIIGVGVDDSVGSLSGVPGAVVIGNINEEIPAGGALIAIDGLSFVL